MHIHTVAVNLRVYRNFLKGKNKKKEKKKKEQYSHGGGKHEGNAVLAVKTRTSECSQVK